MSLVAGLLSGAAGTAALNLVTYLDMAVRGRPPSEVPEENVERLARQAGVEIPGAESEGSRQNRKTALGSLSGFATGIGLGAVYGIVRPRLRRVPLPVAGATLGAAAMAAANVPPTMSGVTDPSTWGAEEWIADIAPHLAYGLVAAVTFDRLQR